MVPTDYDWRGGGQIGGENGGRRDGAAVVRCDQGQIGGDRLFDACGDTRGHEAPGGGDAHERTVLKSRQSPALTGRSRESSWPRPPARVKSRQSPALTGRWRESGTITGTPRPGGGQQSPAIPAP